MSNLRALFPNSIKSRDMDLPLLVKMRRVLGMRFAPTPLFKILETLETISTSGHVFCGI
jgi:hypothetical protein